MSRIPKDTYLSALRLQSGLSQDQLAARIGCSAYTIARFEKGVSQPVFLLDQWLKLGKAYGVSLVELNQIIQKVFSENT